jgi:dTMP kinase
MLLIVDGVDGAGKTTLLDNVVKSLRQSSVKVTRTREPGGCELSEGLRSFIFNNKMDVATETLLMFGSRTEHLRQTVIPALLRGEVVICDRFNSSTYVYQVREKHFDIEVFRNLELFCLRMLHSAVPHLRVHEIILDVSYEVASKRMSQRSDINRLDFKSESEFQARRAAYLERAANNTISCESLDTSELLPQQLSTYVHQCVYSSITSAQELT